MAEATVSAILEQMTAITIDKAIKAWGLVQGAEKEVKRLETNFKALQLELEDAEEKEYVDKRVKLWLDKFRDVSYDMEDVLDEWETAVQQLQIDPFGSASVRNWKFSEEEIVEIYGTRHIGRDQACRLVGLMDFFCFSEACLIVDMVQYFVDAKLEFDACYIYEDVNNAIQHVHHSGLMHRGILSDPHRYLVKNGQLLQFLRILKEKGKRLFLLTNSPYYFVDGGMQFMLE
ncbi:hypothetical protein E1A91_A01G171200v1 [Gossypium mustelinum]|nr:hypothetical protein E1A91_A01G171200v1 [Gossypium mustelinum]